MLRKALEERISRDGREGDGKNLRNEMEQIENDILEKGFDPSVLDRMRKLEHKLLELEDALMEQGEKPERESKTNKEMFQSEAAKEIMRAKEFFNTTEILNRQSLPLRQIYRLKVKEYFERGDN